VHRRAAFSVLFVAIPGVDGIKAIRALLKTALRRFGLRAIDVREIHEPPQPAQPPPQLQNRRRQNH